MSLVAAYGDSDSENSEYINENEENTHNAQNNEIQHLSIIHTSHTPKESSSNDEDEDDETQPKGLTSLTTQESKLLPSADKLPLPVPGFLAKDKNGSHAPNGHLPTTSVFSNPYVEAERAKKLALEKHVKMVDGGRAAITINGKKICWNYRKGRCRFGHNCKYAHDSDLQKSVEQLAIENQIQETLVCQSDNAGPSLRRPNHKFIPQSQTNESISDEEGDFGIKNQKRKRPGLIQGLQPGKKVLKQYQKLKHHYLNQIK